MLPVFMALVLGLTALGCGKQAVTGQPGAVQTEGTAATEASTFEFELDTSGQNAAQTAGEATAQDAGETAADAAAQTEGTTTDSVSDATESTAQTAGADVAAEESKTSSDIIVMPDGAETTQAAESASEPTIDEDGSYTSKEDVALYLHIYGKLPSNFITKKEAKKLGWSGGSLEEYAPGKCIGGDYFGNYEGLLPEDKEYRECDIGTLGKKKRGSKRIIYSDDGYIYYTGDHYESFELLYEP